MLFRSDLCDRTYSTSVCSYFEVEGLLVGRAEVCAVPLEAAGGGLAAATTGAGVGQNVVVTPVLELALGLAPSSAFCVQELAALPLLLPQPADKHSIDPS